LPGMIRLVLFDIDGTLIRTGGAGVRAFAEVFDQVFNARDHFERLKFAGRTDYSLVREFFSFHGVAPTGENFGRFFNEYAARLDANLRRNEITICPGVREFIEHSRSLPEPPVLGLLTGNVRIGAEMKLKRAGLWDAFVTGAFADDHEERDQIAAVARERGAALIGKPLRDNEVLVIGDTPFDICCGRAIGARVLAVGTGGSSMEELRHHNPDYLVNNMAVFNEAWLNGN
jgi:phosphoglycolate phosphatase